MSKGVHVSSECARHRSVYVYISVKGSRVCKPCNVLAVRKYVRASMVSGYTTPSHLKLRILSNIRKCKNTKILNRKSKLTTFKNDRGFASESKVCNEGCNEQQSDYGNCRTLI